MSRFIRYFAQTDDSPTGRLALEYLRALVRLAPVRIATMSGGLSGLWVHYAVLLGTPMTDLWVNAVCCPPARWSWVQKVQMPKMQDGRVVGTEVASERQELYTAGTHNLLLASEAPPEDLSRCATKYEAVVVTSHSLMTIWEERTGRRPLVIPVPVLDHASMRLAVTPRTRPTV